MKTSIFLICHKNEDVPLLSPYTPILAGAEGKNSEGILRDDEGENISSLNPVYNEMTAIYWVYKHLDEFKDSEYIGFCHYRRLWCFQNFKHPVFVRKNIRPEWVSIEQEQLSSFWKEFDAVAPYVHFTRSVRRHYEKSHNKEDLPILESIVEEMAPDYLESFREYMDGDEEYLYNMFILSKSAFKQYGDFVFPILNAFMEKRPYQKERLYVSERLTGAFLYHLRKSGARFLHCPLLFVRSRSLSLAIKETKSNFRDFPEFGFLFKTKPLWLTLLPRFFEQRLRNWSRTE